MKKNRPCQYQYRKIPRFVDERSKLEDAGVDFRIHAQEPLDHGHAIVQNRKDVTGFPEGVRRTVLSIPSVKGAKAGDGIYKFSSIHPGTENGFDSNRLEYVAPYASPGISPSLCSSEISLQARFVELLGKRPLQWSPLFLWGSWVTMIPSRIGKSQALDDAVACFITGSKIHRSKNTECMAIASKEYSKALLSLQTVLTGDEIQLKLSSETLVAVKLLMAFEVSRLQMREERC